MRRHFCRYKSGYGCPVGVCLLPSFVRLPHVTWSRYDEQLKSLRGGTAMKQLGYLSIVLLLLGLLPAALPEGSAPVTIAEAQQAKVAPRTVSVQAGAGQDTVELLSFLPEK